MQIPNNRTEMNIIRNLICMVIVTAVFAANQSRATIGPNQFLVTRKSNAHINPKSFMLCSTKLAYGQFIGGQARSL
jgi:hypothetical protein